MSSQDLDDDLSVWIPPTDAEQKVLEARRERNNKISQIMGQYLLKGYKMLAISCPNCNCILLEDKSRKKYCIGCQEVDDGDTIKDNPAVNELAARKTVEEIQHRNGNQAQEYLEDKTTVIRNDNETSRLCIPTQSSEVVNANKVQESGQNCSKPKISKDHNLSINDIDLTEDINKSVAALRDKLSWATQQLQECQGIHESKQLASLITDISSALLSLKKLVTQ